MLLPSDLPSTQAMPCLLSVKPSVCRKAAVSEGPRLAAHWSDLVQSRTREKHDLVLLWNDRLITPLAEWMFAFSRIVKPQLSAFELPGFPVEKVDEGHAAGSDLLLRIVTMRAEKIPVIAGSYLNLSSRNRKLLDLKFFEHSRQDGADPVHNDLFLRSQFHQHARTAMAVVNRSRLSIRRNDFAAPELGFIVHGV